MSEQAMSCRGFLTCVAKTVAKSLPWKVLTGEHGRWNDGQSNRTTASVIHVVLTIRNVVHKGHGAQNGQLERICMLGFDVFLDGTLALDCEVGAMSADYPAAAVEISRALTMWNIGLLRRGVICAKVDTRIDKVLHTRFGSCISELVSLADLALDAARGVVK